MPTKKSLKIFVDAYLLNKEPQGTKTYIKELYKKIAQLNQEIDIYFGCFKDLDLIKEFESFSNIHFIFFKEKNRLKRMFLEIPEIIKSKHFQYAHFQYIIPFIRDKRCKYIVTIHDILFNDFKEYFSFSYRIKRSFLFRYSARKTDYILTVSEYSKQRLLNIYNLKNNPIYITPNGVNEEYLKAYNKDESVAYIKEKFKVENYILYVSRIEPRKNQEQLLKSFLSLKNKSISLVFIGKKSLENRKLTSLLSGISTIDKERIHFLEDINSSDLMQFYKASNVFVYPSLAEGFGIPPLEAAALQIPVVCSNQTAMSDFKFFKPYHIDFKKEKEVNVILEEVLKNNKSNLEEIQEIIKEKYLWDNAANVVVNLLN